MADIRGFDLDAPQHVGEFGNANRHRFNFRRSAMTNGDVYLFGIIRAGQIITGGEMSNTASTALTTMGLGFRNLDGTAVSPDDGGATFQIPDVAFFLAAATAISAAAKNRFRAPGAIAGGLGTVLRVNRDIILIGTLGGATIATDTLIDVVVECINVGVK